MGRFHFGALALAALSFSTVAVRAQDAETATFDPLKHLPQDSFVVVSVDNVGRLVEKLHSTLIGQMVTHSGWSEAFAGPMKFLEQQVADASSEVKDVTGHDLVELAGLFQGRVVFSIRGISEVGLPELVLAIELGDKKADILALVGRFEKLFQKETGAELQRRRIGNVDATVWPTPAGSAVHAVLGGHLLITTSPDLLLSIDAALSGGDAKSFSSGKVHQELTPHLEVPNREVLIEVDLDGARKIAMQFAGGGDEIEMILKASGLDRVSSFGYALGFDGNATRTVVHLGMRDGVSGVFGALADAFPAVESVDGVFERIPANVDEVSALRVAPGKLIQSIDNLVRDIVPEAEEQIGVFYEQVHAATGMSVKDDLMTLPPITLHSFSVEPPLGGLFNDALTLVKTEELAPYWKLFGQLASHMGAKPKTLSAGGKTVEYINPAGGLAEKGGLLPMFLGDDPSLMAGGIEQAMMGFFLGGFSVSRFERDDGWTVTSLSAQAVRRYVTHYSKAPSLAASEESKDFTDLARQKIVGSSYASVFHAGRSLLWIYNSVLSIATSLGSYASMAGIDVARLPPAEEFAEATGLGYIRFGAGANGYSIETRRGIESGAIVIVALGVAVGAALVVPVLSEGRGHAHQVHCTNNLRQLYAALVDYAANNDGFPHSTDGSIAALNAFLKTKYGRNIAPDIFICLQGAEFDSELDDDGLFELTEDTCSYELVPWKTSPEKNSILLFDRNTHDDGTRNVLFTDGHVEVLDEFDFQEQMESDENAAEDEDL
jgi:prepilin-type processing-associated H-X9-DG protein